MLQGIPNLVQYLSQMASNMPNSSQSSGFTQFLNPHFRNLYNTLSPIHMKENKAKNVSEKWESNQTERGFKNFCQSITTFFQAWIFSLTYKHNSTDGKKTSRSYYTHDT